MSQSDIDAALIQAYADGDFGLPTAYENREFEPALGQPWAALYLIHNAPEVATLGPSGQDMISGIMQITLHYPLNTGAGAARAKADAIRAIFKAGNAISHNGQSVVIMAAARSLSEGVTQGSTAGRVSTGWFSTFVTIEWYAHLNRGL